MATNQLRRVFQTLQVEATPTDGQLLEGYVRGREEAAFAALVRRHGPMVWGVCRRVLRSHHDAEDAFQATFLVLARKAASVAPRELVANWLYGVAHQTALKARATTARRSAREKQVTAMPEPAAAPRELWDDLRPLLDQELSQLPEKYRAVIVLCDLEGKTRREAARHVRVPEGTVASRLATARAMLARRLSRHGLPVSGAALAAVLPQRAAAVPPAVASGTIQAATHFAAGQVTAAGVISLKAVALAEGVLKTMLLTRLKLITAAAALIALAGAGVAVLAQQGAAEKPPAQQARVPAEKPAALPAPPPKAAVAQAAPQEAPKPNGAAKPEHNPACHMIPVKAVDAERHTITFDEKAPPELAGKTLGVARDAGISIDGKPGKLASVPAGAYVNMGLSPDRQTALYVHAQGPNLGECGGSCVKAVDAERHTITFDDKAPPELAGKTFTVAQGAGVSIDGKRGKLADVPPGCCVNLVMSVDGRTALHVHAQGPGVPCDFVGNPVKAVDAERRTVTLGDKARPEVAGKTFTIARDASIAVDGKRATLAQVPPGSCVILRFSADQRKILHISAEGPFVPTDCGGSLVKAIDVARRTVTFDEKVRAEVAGKTFTVAHNATISIDGRRGTLAELPVGCCVNLRLTADQSKILHISAQGPNVPCDCGGSMVKAVDVARHTLTIDDKARAEVAGKTFMIARDATVVIDGKRGKLTELPPGSYVDLRLSADRSAVLYVNAQGPAVSGVVKAVDTTKPILVTEGRSYPVAPDAVVVVNGQRGSLAALPIGATVTLRLHVDQQTVGTIHANAK